MIEINLVPDVKQELLKAQRIRSTVITAAIFIGIASVGVVVALALYVFTVQTARGYFADKSITDNNKVLEDFDDLPKVLTIQNQLTKITDLHASKSIYSRLFDVLRAIIPPEPNDVTFSDLTVNSTDKTITINGQAANSYAAVEVFKKTIAGAKVKYTVAGEEKAQQKTLASNISTSDTSYGQDSTGAKVLRFTLRFTYVDELFSPASQNVSIIIANKGNATDSYLNVPAIFSDRAKDIEEDS